MTIDEKLRKIRADLKARGWSQRDVSVRKDPCTNSYSIHATIRRRGIPIDQVRQIVKAHEKIDRCELTHEVLLGGNTYTSVEYSYDLLHAIQAEVEAEVAQAYEEMRQNPGAERFLPAGVVAFFNQNADELVAYPAGEPNKRSFLWAGGPRGLLEHVAARVAAEPVTVTTEGVTVTASEVKPGNVEIRFPAKPDDATRASLKACGFRWSRRSGCWYGARARLPQDLIEYTEEGATDAQA